MAHESLADPALDSLLTRSSLPSRPLPDGLQYHCFLSYKQSSGLDLVAKQYYILTNRGFECWYDMQYRHDLTIEALQEGLRSSMVYCLFLSKDIFPTERKPGYTYFVDEGIKMAVALRKPIMLFHHPDTGTKGYWSFEDYIKHAPDVLKPYFDCVQSLQIQRLYYLEEATTEQIVTALNKILSSLLPQVNDQMNASNDIMPASPDKPLPDGLQYHCFLSYKQSSAIDLVAKQNYILENLGFKCWYDMQYTKGNLNLEVREEGLRNSMVYCLFLSKDIFPVKRYPGETYFIDEEVKMAFALQKEIILLSHPDTGTPGYWTFEDYIKNAPEVLKPYFADEEAIQLQRLYHLAEATTEQIVVRLNIIMDKLVHPA